MAWYQPLLLAVELSQDSAHPATVIPALQYGAIRCSWVSFHLTASIPSQHPCLLENCCLNHLTGCPLLCVVYKANTGKGTEKSVIIDISYAGNTHAATAASAPECKCCGCHQEWSPSHWSWEAGRLCQGNPEKFPSVLPKASAARAWTQHSTTCCGNSCICFYFLFSHFLHIPSPAPEVFLSNRHKNVSRRYNSTLLCWLFVMRTHVEIFSVI